jgi:hypothetical protein
LIGFAIKAYELCWQAIEKTKKQCFARQFIPETVFGCRESSVVKQLQVFSRAIMVASPCVVLDSQQPKTVS